MRQASRYTPRRVPEDGGALLSGELGDQFAARVDGLGVLDDQMDKLAQSRSALARYIDAAARTGDQSYPPFDDAGRESVPA